LPPGVAPSLGPITTGLGEIYMFNVEAEAGARNADGSEIRRLTCAPCRIGSSSRNP